MLRQKKREKHRSTSTERVIADPMAQEQLSGVFLLESLDSSMLTVIAARQINIQQRAEQLINFVSTIDDLDFF